MTAPTVARPAYERGRRWLESGERALEDRRWDDAVYSAQMAAEQASKGLLLAAGAENTIPQHDIEKVARIVADLASRRSQAAYGFESEIGVEAFRTVAPPAVRDAAYVLHFVRAALGLTRGAGPTRSSRRRPSRADP